MGSRILSIVVRHGNNVACWNIMPISRRGPSTGWPSSMMLPVLGGVRPAMIFSNVVLPQPDGPITPTISPRRTAKSMPLSAGTLVVPVSYVLTTCRAEMISSSPAGTVNVSRFRRENIVLSTLSRRGRTGYLYGWRRYATVRHPRVPRSPPV